MGQETEACKIMAPESAAEEEARLQHEHLRDDVLKPPAGGMLVRIF